MSKKAKKKQNQVPINPNFNPQLSNSVSNSEKLKVFILLYYSNYFF